MTATSAPNQSNLLTPHTFSSSNSTPPLAYRFRLIGLIDKSLSVLKILNRYSFSGKDRIHEEVFSDAFYEQVMKRNESLKAGDLLLNYLAVFNDIPVGALCTKTRSQDCDSEDLLIVNVCVLPAYRKLGIGKQIMSELREMCERHNSEGVSEGGDKGAAKKPHVRRIVMDEVKCVLSDTEKDTFLRKVGFEKIGDEWAMEIRAKTEE